MYTIYRLEHSDSKLGAYRHCCEHNLPDYIEYLLDMHNNKDLCTHPGIFSESDFKLDTSVMFKLYYFGCMSLDSLLNWFENCLQILLDYGFCIYKIVLSKKPYIGRISNQCAFRLDTVLEKELIWC